MDINYDLYKVFCSVARNKSFSAAANELFITQSAVSQTIAQLESKLGGKLFNRGKGGASLTREGETLYSYVGQACGLIENAESKFEQMKNLKRGGIRISASDTVCSLFLLDILKEYREKYPDIHIHVNNSTTKESLALLKSGEVDIAFVNLPATLDGNVEVREVFEINDCFVTGERYRELCMREVSVAELVNYPLLLLEKANSRAIIDKFLLSHGLDITPAIELGSMELLMDFTEIGFGVSAVIEQQAAKRIESGKLFKLKIREPLAARSIGMATVRGMNASFAERALCEMLASSKIHGMKPMLNSY